MTDGTAQQSNQSKAKVFISYGRKDIAFADRLDAALKARGFEPLIDRTDIDAFEQCWDRIKALISRADTVVFVISPDAVASEIALKEVAEAASLNKRFAPVLWRWVNDKLIPTELAKLNFIAFDAAVLFEQRVDQLAEALNTDIGWIRQHTDFGEQARRWRRRRVPRGCCYGRLSWSRQSDGSHRGRQGHLRRPRRRRRSSETAVRGPRGGAMF